MIPEFLYHYTSIESLAMILSTKKIRFNSLSNVDDPIEGQCKEYQDIGNYYFVSSWTDLEEESLPFWNMYTPDMKGVRIKMPSDLFYEYPISSISKLNIKHWNLKSIVPQDDIFKESSHLIRASRNYLFKIEYTNVKEKLYPTVESIVEEGVYVNTNLIGVYKSDYWKFQSEWRYIINILPLPSKQNAQLYSADSNFLDDAISSLRNGTKLSFTDYFVNINETKFKRMEIVMGPKHTDSDKIIVESLINNYNPGIKLTISNLHQKIRR